MNSLIVFLFSDSEKIGYNGQNMCFYKRALSFRSGTISSVNQYENKLFFSEEFTNNISSNANVPKLLNARLKILLNNIGIMTVQVVENEGYKVPSWLRHLLIKSNK